MARAACPRSNPYLIMRDQLGTLYDDQDFAALFSKRGRPCIGYLEHPFKTRHVVAEKDLHSLLANTGGLVYNPKSSTACSCSNDDTLLGWSRFFMAGVLTYLQQLKDGCWHALSSRLTRWTKPLTSSLPLATLTDLGQSKSELIAENALLRQQLVILKRQVKRPPITRADRILLVLLARWVRIWQQALVIVQPDTLLKWHRELFHLYWKRKSKAHTRKPKVAEETIALPQRDGQEQSALGC